MGHYYSPHQDSDPDLREFHIQVGEKTVSLLSASGVFSKGHMDTGTQVLINHAAVSSGQRVHDLGCGVGVVGISLALLHPGLQVSFSDVNERAIAVTKINLVRAGVRGEAVVSDGFARIDKHFDAILLNPPFHAGKGVCMRLITEAYEHLVPGGSLQIVARHKKGGASLEEHMRSVFGDVETLGKKSGFRVYLSRRQEQ